jgi:ribosomal-protein-alanine N-acetyltransferase
METARLALSRLTLEHAAFILELLNTEGWLRNIGDRNVHTLEDAQKYIMKIQENENIRYWAVRLKEEKAEIGIITLIKRDYLEQHDIGFAFLPRYAKQGYAREAAQTVMDWWLEHAEPKNILATTIKDNHNSIRLLEKLGLHFLKTIVVGEDELLLYGMGDNFQVGNS